MPKPVASCPSPFEGATSPLKFKRARGAIVWDRHPNGTPVLIIKQEFAREIFAGRKTVEIRGQSTTKLHQWVGISVSGSSAVSGEMQIMRVEGPLDTARYRELAQQHRVGLVGSACARFQCHGESGGELELPYAKTFAWFLTNVREFDAVSV